MEKYDNCISLGWFCGTAGSLAKLGLRNFSAPFDWCYSDFSSVINQIDNEFCDFMKKENLEIVTDKPKEFQDKKYGFYYNHDVRENFEIEYTDIYNKYIRRAKRFLESIKKPTMFFRAVRSENEIDYITNNIQYIKKVLKRYNFRNEIIYILLNDMKPLPNDIKTYRLTIEQYRGELYDIRHMFDCSKRLVCFCKTLMSEEQIDKNLEYDMQKNGQKIAASKTNYYVKHNIDGIDKKILNLVKLQDNELFYIWGG